MTLFVLLGPTAVGKTEFALQMAEELGSPILNCDSRQIFRGMEIGTAAPTAENCTCSTPTTTAPRSTNRTH